MADRVRAAFADPAPEPDWTDRDAVVEYLVEGERRFADPDSFDQAALREVARRVVERTVNLESSTKNHWLVEGGEDTRPRLGEVRAPTLVIHGTEDPLFPPGHAVALARDRHDRTAAARRNRPPGAAALDLAPRRARHPAAHHTLIRPPHGRRRVNRA